MSQRTILKKYNSKKLEWLYDARWFILTFIFLFVAFRYFIGISVVSGDSMDPSYIDGEVVLYLRTCPKYEVGDVISVRVPSGDYYIKRIVACPGDTVDIRRNNLYVNGARESFAAPDGITKRQKGTVVYPYKVRKGDYFIVGDNRDISVDSRYFGEVTAKEIKGKIILSLFRMERVGQ